MANTSQSRKSKKKKKWYENQGLLIAILGLATALITVSPQLIGALQRPEPTQTPLPATATRIIEPTLTTIPTETSVPPTEILSPTPTQTASPSPTPTQISPPISCLDRWQIISSNPDLTETSGSGNCEVSSVPDLGISASGRGISFGVNNFRERGTFGISTSLPIDATITLNVSLTVLTQGEFWIALSNTPTPGDNIFILGFQPRNGELRTYSDQTSAFSEKYDFSDLTTNTNLTSGPPYVYNIILETSGNRVSPQIHFTNLPSHIVNLPNYLFIGYNKTSTLGSVSMQVEIEDLTVEIE